LADGAVAPATTAGFKEGDRLQTYNGAPIASWSEFVDLVRADGGETVAIGFERGREAHEATTTLAYTDVPVVVDDEIVVDASGNTVYEKAGYFGAAPEVARERLGVVGTVGSIFGGLRDAFIQSVQGLWQMVIGFPKLIASVFGGNQEVLDEVRPISPIGLVRLAGPMESTLLMLALVNVFVGVLNFIPLFPLDGGHFIVAAYEKVTGRVPDIRRLMPVAAVVVIFLISVGLMGVYLDIFKPLQL
jgi:membrane-associated protease RseP (regulator of RpoE activity)